MQATSDLHKKLLRNPAHLKEARALIAGDVYENDRVVSIRPAGGMFRDKPGIGGTVCRELDITLRDPGAIPRAAEIKIEMRLVVKDELAEHILQAAEWLPKGTFYIDTRKDDKETGGLVIHAVDAMRKTETPFMRPGDQGEWPRTDISVVEEICERIGVTLAPRTRAVLTRGYLVQYPGFGDGAYTMREVLGYVGAMYAGNWVINDLGQAQLLMLGDIPPETHYLIEEHGDIILIGGVRILV